MKKKLRKNYCPECGKRIKNNEKYCDDCKKKNGWLLKPNVK